MTNLTARQAEVLSTIEAMTNLFGYSPTVQEIARELSIAPNSAYDHLRALRKAGKVDWAPHKARTLRVL